MAVFRVRIEKPVAVAPRKLRNDALADPRFWALHYYLLIGVDGNEAEVVEPCFGVSDKAVNDYHTSEFDPSRSAAEWAWLSKPWTSRLFATKPAAPTYPAPFLDVPVADGYSVQVEYSLDIETVFSINHPTWPSPVVLGQQSGCDALPAFRWAELLAIWKRTQNAAAFLLPLPAVSLREDEVEAAAKVQREAWTQLGLVNQARLGEMVEAITAHLTGNVTWTQERKLGWICNSRSSLRNPDKHFDRVLLDRVKEFFLAVGGD
jgi:hypothetical protein